MTAHDSAKGYVVDTSVVLKWFIEREESDVPQARRLRDAYHAGRCNLSAPELLLIELANALKAGHRFNAKEIVEILESIRGLDLILEAFRWTTLAKAVEIASSRGRGVTVYDAYFLALAIESGSMLVTADEVFIRRAGVHPNLVSLRKLRLPS